MRISDWSSDVCSSDLVTALDLWQGPVDPQPLSGGIPNKNYLVEDAGRRYVVRVGDDIPIHQVMRFNELAASLAAAQAGISPAVVPREPGVLVLEHIPGRPLAAADLRRPGVLQQALPLVDWKSVVQGERVQI